MRQGFIKYIVIIIVILLVVFLSQQAYFRGASKIAGTYLSKGTDWITSKIYPKINNQLQGRGDEIKNSVDQTKNFSESIGTKIENYFSGISNSILHPETPQNCLPAQASQPSQTQ